MSNTSTRSLPIGGHGRLALGWWGIWTLIATEGSLFAYLLFSHAYMAILASATWFPEKPSLRIAVPSTLLLLLSSFVFRRGEQAIRAGNKRGLMIGLTLTLAMGSVFVALQLLEWRQRPYRISDGAYASSYFTTTGFHVAHVMAGLLIIATLLAWTCFDKFTAQRHAAVSIGALYWHFVDAVWLAVFLTYDVWPYLLQ